MPDRIRLDSKVAVVTGAAGVIGTATMRLLAERGARIVAVDRREPDLNAAAVYKAVQEAGRPPYETVTPAEARELYLKGRFVTNPEPPELLSVKPLSIPAPHGAIPARIYMPKSLRKADGLAPCLVFF